MASALNPRTIVLAGFMGAGKSTAARALGEHLHLADVDVDEVIEHRMGKSVVRIFAEEGEAAFRRAEEEITLELLDRGPPSVLALGGGAVGSERVRRALRDHLVIWLDVDAATAWKRVHHRERPLAAQRQRFESLHAQREPLYAEVSDVTVLAHRPVSLPSLMAALEEVPAGVRTLWATSTSGEYPVYIGGGLLEQGFWPATVPGRRFLVTDGNAGRLYSGRLEPLAGQAAIMPGEPSKTVAHAEIVWTELMRAGMTRGDLVVALGGGVVGDLAGFCAATYQRGVRWVGVPTTLVAQVDSAYGGKTGVDLPEAKNYVGAYHQPSAVVVDPQALGTLPAAELAAGYAEVVKTALIAGGPLWARVREGVEPSDEEVIWASALTKLRIVARDERDVGPRQWLNLGHTVGHAIEAATGYARYRHGEAVALGLLAALRLSEQAELRREVETLLSRQGLPTRLEATDPDAVVMATARDKKRTSEGPVPFVLLDGPGRVRAGQPVDSRALIEAVRELAA